jgi:hypothetical protein
MNTHPDPHPSRPQGRIVFILRLWTHGRDQPEWIVEIQDVQTGEIAHLQRLDALPDWLKQKTDQVVEPFKGKKAHQ